MNYELVCTSCKCRYIDNDSIFRCLKCEGILEVSYNYKSLKLKNFKKIKYSYDKYLPFYPINGKLISMGEGSTELIKTTKLKLLTNINELYLKIETENPSKSFKDRGSAVEITKAIELGFTQVCCASTGNMGLSIAKYARKIGINCTVFISKNANPEKINKIRKQHAKIILINGDYNKASRLAEKFAIKNKVFLCGDYHYRKEGQKSVMFEIIDQLHYKVPDYIFIQVGNGTLFAAMYKALVEFRKFKLIKKLPKLIAVQSSLCSPLITAYNNKNTIKYIKPRTYADAIAVGYPTFGFECINAINKTRGSALCVSDVEIESARAILAKNESIASEPGGAVGLAGLIKMYDSNKKMFKNKSAAVIITGNNEGKSTVKS